MKKLLIILFLSIGLIGCSSIELEAVSTSQDEIKAKKSKIGLVNFTNTFIKKNSESSFWKMFIADLPISVYITTPSK